MKRKLIKAAALASVVILAALAAVSCGHTHLFSEMKVAKAATCTSEGEVVYTCECGYSETKKIEALEHVEGAWDVTKHATCTEAGSKTVYCKNCDTKIKSEDIPAMGHDIVSVDAKAATCAETGHKAYEFCTRCNHTTYAELEKLSHTPGKAATCTEPQLCKVCENEVAPALGHVNVVTAGKEATCEKEGLSDLVECSRCEKVIEEQIVIPKREHAPATVTGYPSTCTKEGVSDGVICLVCNEELVKQIDLPVNNEHNYSSTSKRCKDCGYYKNEDCEHEEEDEDGDVSFLKTIRAKSASCDKYGLTAGEYCTECTYVTEVPEIVEPSEHNVEIIKGYPATLTKPGLTDGEYCKKCKCIVKQQELIPVISEGIGEETAAAENNGGKLKYEINGDTMTCTVTGMGSCTAKNIIIPSSIDTYRVTAIGKNAFYGESIVSVVVPNSVEVIEEKAFGGCTKLTKITLSDKIDIDEDAFIGSSSLELDFTHKLVYVSKVDAECDEPGRKAHYVCIYCGTRFTDKTASTVIYKIQTTVSHDFEDEDDDEAEKCVECGTPREEVYVTEIDTVSNKSVKIGTTVKGLKLPATVTAITEDEEEHELAVVWDTSSYKSNTAGTYTVKGYILTGGYDLARKVDDEITITVTVK